MFNNELEKEEKNNQESNQTLFISPTIDLWGMKLYSGDIITLKCGDGSYWDVGKNGEPTEGDYVDTIAVTSEKAHRWVVEIVGHGTINLKSKKSSLYLKRGNPAGIFLDSCFYSYRGNNSSKNNFSTLSFPIANKIILISDDDWNLINAASTVGMRVITNSNKTFELFSVNREGTMGNGDKFIRCDYDLDQAETSLQPFIVGSKITENPYSETVTREVTITDTISTNKSFAWEESYMFGQEISFKTEVPLVGEFGTTFKSEQTFTKSGSGSTTQTTTISDKITVPIKPMSSVKVTLEASKGRINVPYKAVLEKKVDTAGGEKTYQYEVEGVFEGITAYAVKMRVEEITQSRFEEMKINKTDWFSEEVNEIQEEEENVQRRMLKELQEKGQEELKNKILAKLTEEQKAEYYAQIEVETNN